MTKEAMKLALARLQARTDTADLNAIAALNEALDHIANGGKMIEQPAQQEPVAEIVSDVNGYLSTQWFDKWTPNPGDKLYTSPPPQRTWVGLTNDEVNNIAAGCHLGNSVQDAIFRAEARLKEKNT